MKLDDVDKLIDAREAANVKAYCRIFDAEKAISPASARNSAESEILWLIDDFNSHGENTPVGRLLLKALEVIVETAPHTLYNDKQRDATIRSLYVAESVSELLGVQNKKIREGIQSAKKIALHSPHTLASENARSDTFAAQKLNA